MWQARVREELAGTDPQRARATMPQRYGKRHDAMLAVCIAKKKLTKKNEKMFIAFFSKALHTDLASAPLPGAMALIFAHDPGLHVFWLERYRKRPPRARGGNARDRFRRFNSKKLTLVWP